jgi:hypothetical protein
MHHPLLLIALAACLAASCVAISEKDRLTILPIPSGLPPEDIEAALTQHDFSYYIDSSGVKVPLENFGIRFRRLRSSGVATPTSDFSLHFYSERKSQASLTILPHIKAGVDYQDLQEVTVTIPAGELRVYSPEYVWTVDPGALLIPERIPQDVYVASNLQLSLDGITATNIDPSGNYKAARLSVSDKQRIADAFEATYGGPVVFGRWEAPQVDPLVYTDPPRSMPYRVGHVESFSRSGPPKDLEIKGISNEGDWLSFTYRGKPYGKIPTGGFVVVEEGRGAMTFGAVTDGILKAVLVELNQESLQHMSAVLEFEEGPTATTDVRLELSYSITPTGEVVRTSQETYKFDSRPVGKTSSKNINKTYTAPDGWRFTEVSYRVTSQWGNRTKVKRVWLPNPRQIGLEAFVAGDGVFGGRGWLKLSLSAATERVEKKKFASETIESMRVKPGETLLLEGSESPPKGARVTDCEFAAEVRLFRGDEVIRYASVNHLSPSSDGLEAVVENGQLSLRMPSW